MAETKTKTVKQDPWTEKKSIRLDKSIGKSVYVAVNGRAYNVPTGKEYEVPVPIYEKLVEMQEQMDVLDDVRDDIAKETRENMKGL